MRENAATKARRYLVEGRIVLDRLDPNGVTATARGDGQLYRMGWDHNRGWWCTCEARSRCSHLMALGSVVAIDLGGR